LRFNPALTIAASTRNSALSMGKLSRSRDALRIRVMLQAARN
jgi:hypothetical protein